MSTITTGTVKSFNPDKGFGYIEQKAGSDVLIHFKNIANSEAANPLAKAKMYSSQSRRVKQISRLHK